MSRSEAVTAALTALPRIARDETGPVFAEPWHAQAFVMAVALNERGLFSWKDWSGILAAELRRVEAAGEVADEDAYYRAWLTALERILADRNLIAEGERRDREAAWLRAARATPHGEPIELGREERD